MSVKREPSGRRSVQVEVEVPGTPEQVWQAIATGPGISSWFVPTKLEPRVGGKMTLTFGPGMDAVATITGWDPPRKLTAESSDFAPGAPPMATEWTVEAKSGGKCIVRVVHSLFASNDDWDNQLESTETGWPAFFTVLRHYLAHHAGQPSAAIHAMAMAGGTPTEAWTSISGPLGLTEAKQGQRTQARTPGAPPFAGVVELKNSPTNGHGAVVHLSEPAPGAAIVGAYDCGGPVMAMVSIYLYGPRAAEAARRDEAAWQAWVGGLFAVKA